MRTTRMILFHQAIIKNGKMYPKKHGAWYVVKVLGQWLVYDTWNGQVVVTEGDTCEPSGHDVYGNVVAFGVKKKELLCSDFGETYEHHMMDFWRLHIGITEKPAAIV